jgi:hypothetical protein
MTIIMKQRNLTFDDAVNRQLWRLKSSNRWTTGILIRRREDLMADARKLSKSYSYTRLQKGRKMLGI